MKICTQGTLQYQPRLFCNGMSDKREKLSLKRPSNATRPTTATAASGKTHFWAEKDSEKQETLSTAFTMPVPVSSSESSTVVMPSP